jgi:type IX secretion system PorP/SprF family membrane protein
MKKIYLSACLFLTTVLMAVAQQRAQFTQYMINPFLYNPAVSGTEDYTDIRAGYRKQWTGFEGAPRSIYLSAHTNIGKSRVVNKRVRNKKNGFHGIGAVLTNDEIGATSTTTISAAYSYHLKLSEKVFASLGAMAGLQQYSLESSKLTTGSGGDAAINGFSNRSLADINIGGWVYSDKFYAGATMIQVVPQKLYNMNTSTIEKGKLAHHYMIMAGYRIPLGYDFTFIPSFCLKAVSPAPISCDINSKIRYKNLGWIGLSYRHKDALAAMIGVIIGDTFDVSYSYDYTTSHITKFSGGSHEVVVGYRLRTKQQIVCPSNFW